MSQVREATNALVALHTKALIWMRRHALEDNRVKIQQLASSLRVGVAQAEEIVGFLMRNQSDRHAFAVQYKIFVINNQIPDWMRRYLAPSTVAAVLLEARKLTNTVMHRDLHRQVLAKTYGNALKGMLVEEYLSAEIALMNSLQCVYLEDPASVGEYPQLERLDNPLWYEGHYGGGSSHLQHNREMANGTKYTIHFGALSDDSLDSLNYSTIPDFEVMAHQKCSLTAIQTAECVKKVRGLIEEMQLRGYGFHRVTRTYSPGSKSNRTALVFAQKGDIGIAVSVTMPWDSLILKQV